jgi:hypothetical protein
MADVNLFGHKVNPWMAGAIGVGSVAVIWFAWKQHESSAAASAVPAGTSASAIDPLTGLPTSEDNQTDPLTGETYLAEAQQYGSVQAAEQALSGEGLGSEYTGSGYGGYGYGYDNTSGNPNEDYGTTYATNAAWAQAVEAGLTDLGYSPTDVAAALGRYLGNLSETSAQATIVQAAIAEYGPPPVGSYTIIMQSSTGPTGSGSTVTVPDVVGQSLVDAQRNIGYAGLKSSTSGPATTKAGEVREVTEQSPRSGSKVNSESTVKLTYKIANPPSTAKK